MQSSLVTDAGLSRSNDTRDSKSVVTQSGVTKWTNPSVLRFAADGDPIEKMEERVRDVVLRAKDAGWSGPPFNPLMLANILRIPVDATSSVVDARTVPSPDGPRIQYNPQQARERSRFSVAHEIAHTFFEDVGEKDRHRGGDPSISDDWQLEMLCNLAAAEMVMPVGSLPDIRVVAPLEVLLRERLQYDVSVEAFLMRVVKAAEQPITMFVASPRLGGSTIRYSIDYAVSSNTAPRLSVRGKKVPGGSVIHHCTAIGATSHASEEWLTDEPVLVEAVGIPGYPGSSYPRVAALLRHNAPRSSDFLHFVQGTVLNPRPLTPQIVCQLTNDRSLKWGGGVARQMASKNPKAEEEYGEWLKEVPRAERLGEVHYATTATGLTIASLVAQEGVGASQTPRIRYWALNRCLKQVAAYAKSKEASVHMPRLGTGVAGAEWSVVESMLRTHFAELRKGVWVYDLPPRQVQQDLGF